jgi:hypothetical protein
MTEKWFQIVMGDENRREHSLFVHDNNWTVTAFELGQGNQIKNWDPCTKLRSISKRDDGPPDALLRNVMMLPIFSIELRAAMSSAGIATNDIQHLPVIIEKSNGERLDGFTIANVTSRVSALDFENSIMLNVDPAKIDPLTKRQKVVSVWTAALKLKSIEGYDAIRLTEFFPSVFVSRRFKNTFERNQFTGATFKEVRVV